MVANVKHQNGSTLARSRDLVVLFCAYGFEQGYKFSVEAMQKVPGVKVMRCKLEELQDHIASADILVPLMSKLDTNLIKKAKRAKLILQYGVGLEGVDIPTATEEGILVSNMPSGPTGNALSCAEHAIYLALTCLRDQKAMNASVQNRVLGLPCGRTLSGSNCLIVGFGAISLGLVPRLKPFQATISCVRRSAWGDSEVESLIDRQGSWDQLREFASDADIIFLCCVLNETTRNLVNREFLSHCKNGVIIINIARGGLLDYESVSEGLGSGKIGALGADVMWYEPFDPEDPIVSHPSVYITPHVAGVTQLSYKSMAKRLSEEAKRLQDGLLPTIRVNEVDKIRSC